MKKIRTFILCVPENLRSLTLISLTLRQMLGHTSLWFESPLGDFLSSLPLTDGGRHSENALDRISWLLTSQRSTFLSGNIHYVNLHGLFFCLEMRLGRRWGEKGRTVTLSPRQWLCEQALSERPVLPPSPHRPLPNVPDVDFSKPNQTPGEKVILWLILSTVDPLPAWRPLTRYLKKNKAKQQNPSG